MKKKPHVSMWPDMGLLRSGGGTRTVDAQRKNTARRTPHQNVGNPGHKQTNDHGTELGAEQDPSEG